MQTFDANLVVVALEPVRTLMAQTITGDKCVAQLSGLFGMLALFLAVAGLYGVTSYTMSRRTPRSACAWPSAPIAAPSSAW